MTNSSAESILEVNNLNVFYGSLKAVNNVSFTVMAGEIFGLLGPNGAGKTSTLSAIEGLIKPSSGNIKVGGYDITEKPLFAKANMGVQLQLTTFQAELSITEILKLYSGIYGVQLSKERIRTILENIKLEDAANKKFAELSGGQQQRLSLAISTLHDPQLVLLDEPTTGLDPQSRRQLWERIEYVKANNKAILLTTHSMEEAEAVCDRIAIIDHGRIIITDTPQSLIDNYKDDPEVIKVSRKGKITLEDVFIALTGRAIRS